MKFLGPYINDLFPISEIPWSTAYQGKLMKNNQSPRYWRSDKYKQVVQKLSKNRKKTKQVKMSRGYSCEETSREVHWCFKSQDNIYGEPKKEPNITKYDVIFIKDEKKWWCWTLLQKLQDVGMTFDHVKVLMMKFM